jgi:hypothetical protein
MRWAGNVTRMRRRGMHREFWWENQKERGHRKTRHRWVCDTRIDLRNIGWAGMNWIDLVHDCDQCRALVNTVMNLQVLQNAGKFLSSCATDIFSIRAYLH